MLLLTAFVVLARIGSAEILASSPLCDKLREGRATPEQANSTIGPWAQRQFDEWRGLNATGFRTTDYNATSYNATSHHATGDDTRFWTWFHRKWAPDAADSIISCKLSKVCSAVSCQFVNDQYSLDEQVNAYWSLESITNFHNMAYEIKGANEKAWNSVEGDLPNIIDTFSDGKNIEAEKKRHDKQWKLIGHTITGTTLVVGAACTLLTAGMSAGVIGTADALVIAGTSISKTSIALFGAEVGMLGSADELAGEEEETNTTTEDEFTPENSTRKAVMNSLQPRGEIWDWVKDKANRVKDMVTEVFTTGKNKVKEWVTGKGAESGGTWTNNDPETMFQFLNVTGLYRSKDWWTYCHKRGEHHGNHCRGNKAVNWEGKFPGGAYKKIRHPFAHCKTRGHEFKGCESPNNNGFQENKNCGSGKSGSGQNGMAGMETYDSSYGMAFDAANHLDRTEDMDEAELSDWTDGGASDAEDDASMDEFSGEGDFE
ncbi:hypothetical protein E4T47_08502 [Aureobasidium subglaciale]|nr:hypothetical protein E4T47_08502 [Aureobasidium subglaciale]